MVSEASKTQGIAISQNHYNNATSKVVSESI
jgi:hypothetical protein